MVDNDEGILLKSYDNMALKVGCNWINGIVKEFKVLSDTNYYGIDIKGFEAIFKIEENAEIRLYLSKDA